MAVRMGHDELVKRSAAKIAGFIVVELRVRRAESLWAVRELHLVTACTIPIQQRHHGVGQKQRTVAVLGLPLDAVRHALEQAPEHPPHSQ